MRALSLVVLLIGLAAGVVSMLAGIDQRERGGLRVKYLNLPTLAAGATVFGVVAYPLVQYSTLSKTLIVAIAASAGMAGAVAMVVIIAGWAVPSATREVKDTRYALQGHFARITASIAAQAQGEIEFTDSAVVRRAPARSLDGSPIEAGAEVVIERIEEGIAHVERWSTIARQLELPQ
jgi:membrane protein implicated in regulation of membrane protease activity